MDKYTFQFAEPRGKAAMEAFGLITTDFLRGFNSNSQYASVVLGYINTLLQDGDLNEELLKELENSINVRINTLLEEERMKDSLKANKDHRPLYKLKNDEDEDSEDEPEQSEEELARIRREAEEAAELERKRQEEYEERRARNEEILRERERKVDTSALDAELQQSNVTVFAPKGWQPKKKGGGGGGGNKKQHTKEELVELEAEIAAMTKEKERLQVVVHTASDSLEAKLKEAEQSLAETKAEFEKKGKANVPPKNIEERLINGRHTELTQKLTKLTTERNRFAMQLKSDIDGSGELRNKIAEVLKARDEIQIELDKHNA